MCPVYLIFLGVIILIIPIIIQYIIIQFAALH